MFLNLQKNPHAQPSLCAGKDMAEKTMLEAKLVAVVQENAKMLERMSWRNMDYEEYAEAFLPFLKGLGKVSCNLTKAQISRALTVSKLALSSAETALLTEKTRGCISYIKKKIRDSGSGKFLPRACQALIRTWSKYAEQIKEFEEKKKKRDLEKLSRSEKEKDVEKKQDEQKDLKSTSIRDVLGLSVKKEVVCTKVDLVGDDDDDEVDWFPPSTSSASASSSSASGLSGQ